MARSIDTFSRGPASSWLGPNEVTTEQESDAVAVVARYASEQDHPAIVAVELLQMLGLASASAARGPLARYGQGSPAA